jgi:hypothetical protein
MLDADRQRHLPGLDHDPRAALPGPPIPGHEGSIDPVLLTANQLDDYARVIGAVLARAHAQSADPRILTGYCDGAAGSEHAERFDLAMARFVTAYADQTETDHTALVAAVKNGRFPALFLES